MVELQRAVELEPLAMLNNSVLTSAYILDRKYDQALVQARSTYDLEPNFGFARSFLGFALIANGKYDEAISVVGQVPPDSPFGWMSVVVIAHAYANQGKRAEAEQQISRLRDLMKTRYLRTYYLAEIYAALGDKEKAFVRIVTDPEIDPLCDVSRFKSLLKRMNL